MNTTTSPARFLLTPRLGDGNTLRIGEGQQLCEICAAVAARADAHVPVPGAVLAPCRACPRREQISVVSLGADGEMEFFGRTELLCALRQAYYQSTNGDETSKVGASSDDPMKKFKWATSILPRDMLRATPCEDHVLLWVQRKKYCYVSLRVIELVRGGDTRIAMNQASVTDEDGRVWVGPTVLEHGDILQFRQHNKAVMEFQLCRVVPGPLQLLEERNQEQQTMDIGRVLDGGSSRASGEVVANDDSSKFHGIIIPNYCNAEVDYRISDDESDGSAVDNSIDVTIESQAGSQQPSLSASHQKGTEKQNPPSLLPDVQGDQSGVPTKLLLTVSPTTPPQNGMFPISKPVTEPERIPALFDPAVPSSTASVRAVSDQLLHTHELTEAISMAANARNLVMRDIDQTDFTHSASDMSGFRASKLLRGNGNCQTAVPSATNPSIISSDTTGSSTVFADDVKTGPEEQFIVYICERGTYLNHWSYDGVKPKGIKQKAKERGATVLDSFHKNQPPWPTHLVIPSDTSDTADDNVPSLLGFSDHDEMLNFLEKHGIVCVNPDWILTQVSLNPGQQKQLIEFTPLRPPPLLCKPAPEYLRHKFSGKSKRMLPYSNDSPASSRQRTEATPPNLNTDLSDMFRKISKLYRECPLDEKDEMKSYSYQKAAGRLCYLDFKVTNSQESFNQLKTINGFGVSMIKDVSEYFSRDDGTCSRLQMFETNKDRLGLRAMKKIWGVGHAKALELVKAGYYRIGDVRRDLEQGSLKLERNQLIGVMYYEDFQEKMSRSEVESIFRIICDCVHDRYPQAEMHLMGSYRRGNETCGDADVIFWSPTFVDDVPPKALGKIVDDLRRARHIEHHLTQISGMDAASFETLDPKHARKLINPETFGRSSAKTDRTNCSSWMGVFNSPTMAGKRRHVDIKFYPYKERVYASLYFTGNGFFNRSMRLWARHKHNLKLSDHGLRTTTGMRVLENAETERDVFDFLDLKWKEPHERNNFDDVQSRKLGESTWDLLDSLNSSDLTHDEDQTWIA